MKRKTKRQERTIKVGNYGEEKVVVSERKMRMLN